MGASPTFDTTSENIRRLTCLIHGIASRLGTTGEHVSGNGPTRFYAHLAEVLIVGGKGNADARVNGVTEDRSRIDFAAN